DRRKRSASGKSPRGRDAVDESLPRALGNQSLNRLTRHQYSALRLEECPLDVVERELREALLAVRSRKVFQRNSSPLQRSDVPLRVGILLALQPENSCLMEGRASGTTKELLPLPQRGKRHARVEFVRALAHADEPRLAARARATVGGAVRVEQRHRQTALPQVPGSPRPEGTGTDHHDIGTLLHRFSSRFA